MEEKFYKPKEIAEMLGITVRTLQYYDKVDLLKPSYKNDKGYRFYISDDIHELRKIISLKFLGFSIDEIRKILESDSKENIERLKEKKRDLEHEIKKLTIINECLEDLDVVKHENEIDWLKIAGSIKTKRIESHKIQYGDDVRDKEKHGDLHKELMDILIEILNSKGSEEEKQVKRLRVHMNNMTRSDNGLEVILENLKDISDMPGKIRGLPTKDALTIAEKIEKYR
ncbi:MAG: MerR family transcriptional regulator [Clostridium sp.]|uniref:MerR family transcriptional regulator n=1 Tax=Clostridium sp. TaxID=1506 RepID=UPI003F3C302D